MSTPSNPPPPQPQRRIYVSPDSDQRLRQMGITANVLVQAVTDGDSGRAQCGPFHPRQSKGHRMWSDTTASLRRRCIALADGWMMDRTGGMDTVTNLQRRISIAVVGGDTFTGVNDELRDPRVVRKRGPETKRRVYRNARRFGMEPMAFEVAGVSQSDDVNENAPETWFLLIRATDERMWLELSTPVGVGESGYVDSWRERIILPSFEVTGGVTPIPEDDDGGPAFSVEKK